MYKTSDTRLASFLIINGFALTTIDRTDPSRVVFVFEELDSKLKTVVDIWDSGSPIANILKYEITKKELLNKIYAKKID